MFYRTFDLYRNKSCLIDHSNYKIEKFWNYVPDITHLVLSIFSTTITILLCSLWQKKKMVKTSIASLWGRTWVKHFPRSIKYFYLVQKNTGNPPPFTALVFATTNIRFRGFDYFVFSLINRYRTQIVFVRDNSFFRGCFPRATSTCPECTIKPYVRETAEDVYAETIKSRS